MSPGIRKTWCKAPVWSQASHLMSLGFICLPHPPHRIIISSHNHYKDEVRKICVKSLRQNRQGAKNPRQCWFLLLLPPTPQRPLFLLPSPFLQSPPSASISLGSYEQGQGQGHSTDGLPCVLLAVPAPTCVEELSWTALRTTCSETWPNKVAPAHSLIR